MCVFMTPHIWEVFPIISSNIFPFLCFSFCDSCNIYIGTFDDISQVPPALLILLHCFFFLSLTLNNFNCLVFQFTQTFFHLLRSDVEPL